MPKANRATWPLWKCISPEKQAQFIQDVWDKYHIDLLKDDKPSASVTYSGKIESLEEISQIMRQKPVYRGVDPK